MRDTTAVAGAISTDTSTKPAAGSDAVAAAGAGNFIRAERVRLAEHATLNEHWLRERVVDDPSLLGLGDLRLADEGQVRDGRLELLLRDPATGRRIIALVRVGPAEDGDLVRAIENWTIERTRYPEHEHYAIIVAEELPPRFLSAANTLGATIPLSAVQVSALRVGEHVALHFAVVIDRLPARAVAPVAERPHRNGTPVATTTPEPAGVTPDHTPTEAAAPAAKPSSNGATSARHSVAEATAPAVATVTAPRPVAPEAVSTRMSATDPWDDRPANTTSADVKLPTWLSDQPDDSYRDDGDDSRAGAGAGGRLLAFVAFLSFVLCIVAVFGWVRSYNARDEHTFADGSGRDHFLYSDKGQIEWIAPASAADPGGGRAVRVPYWLPAGLTAILPFAWLIRRHRRGDVD